MASLGYSWKMAVKTIGCAYLLSHLCSVGVHCCLQLELVGKFRVKVCNNWILPDTVVITAVVA